MIEVYLIFDVDFGMDVGFTKEFKALSVADALVLAEEYTKSEDYAERAKKFEDNPKFVKNFIYQIKHFDGNKSTIVYDYYNGMYNK